MIPKQDRIKPRTVEDLERMYQFKAAAQNSRETYARANEAQSTAKEAQQSAEQASKRLEDKVDKTDDAQIITMINRATEIIHLIGKRLKVETDNFTLTEDGKVTMSDATIKSSREVLPDVEIPVTTEIKEGTIILEPNYTIWGEGEQVTFDLLQFKFFDKTYILQMVTYWAGDTNTETGETSLRLAFERFAIAEAT